MNEQSQFEKAITAIRKGDADEGRNILIGMLKANPKNELAWLWLARSLPNDEKRIAALELCLKVNPTSETARRTLVQLQTRRGTGSVSPPVRPLTTTEPLPGRTVLDSTPVAPKSTPLTDRVARQISPGGLSENPALPITTAQSNNIQPQPLVNEPVKIIRRYNTQAPTAPRQRLIFRLSTELLLGLLLLGAAIFLGWAFFNNLRTPQPDIAHQGLQATASELENEISILKLQVSQRQTQTAIAPTPTPISADTPTPTTQTADITPNPQQSDVISPINAARLVAFKQLPASFTLDLEYSPNGLWLAGASYQSVSVWDAASLEPVQQIDLDDQAVSLAFSPDSGILAFTQSGDEGNLSYLFSASTMDWVKLLSGLSFPNSSMALRFTPSGDRLVLVTSANDTNINLVNIADGRRLSTLDHTGGILAADIETHSGFLATGGYDDQVRIWDLSAQQEVTSLSGHAADVTALAFSLDGSVLASASADGALMLWDTNSWQVKLVLKGQPGGVTHLAFSPYGYVLATCDSENGVLLWDVKTGAKVASLVAPAGVEDLAFSPDGFRLAAAGKQAVVFWALPSP